MTCALIVYANGSEDMEVTAITDILNRGVVKVTKAALNDDGGLKVTLAHGTMVVCDKNLNDCSDDYAVIAIPGGLVGAENCRDSKVLIKKLQEQKAKGGYIAAICAAPGFVLGTHGLVGAAKATGYPGCADNIENCRLVVTIDLGDDHNIHPSKKKAVGERLAAVALNDTYGRTEIQCCFPEVESVTRIGEQEIKVKFRNVYDGLHFEGAWNEFEVSSDGVLYARPECSAEGDDVLVFKTNIDSIKYLRYCWRDNCRSNLYNSAGLPAGPFYIKVP